LNQTHFQFLFRQRKTTTTTATTTRGMSTAVPTSAICIPKPLLDDSICLSMPSYFQRRYYSFTNTSFDDDNPPSHENNNQNDDDDNNNHDDDMSSTGTNDVKSSSLSLQQQQQQQQQKYRTQYTIDDTVCLPTQLHALQNIVQKRCQSLDVYLRQKPIAHHTQCAFTNLLDIITVDNNYNNNFQTSINTFYPNGIIFDSGCGTGRSTKYLSQKYPKYLIIGIDRSFVRLTKPKSNLPHHNDNKEENDDGDNNHNYQQVYCHRVTNNAYLVRAELVDFWRCCVEHDREFWTSHIKHHYMLYPNPYPTNQRLSQRWYAHPSFPLLLQLKADTIIFRSNWKQYLIELAKAIKIAHAYYEQKSGVNSHENVALPYLESAKKGPHERTDKTIALTNFEAKYDTVGEPTYELILSYQKRY
jgi:tRNA G46 methylase TrmB